MSVDTVKNNQLWEQFSLLPKDLDYLANHLVEIEQPQTLEQLTQELIQYRHRQIMELAQQTLAQGRIYRPAESYQVGERVIFPHLGNLLGDVIKVRPGHNPEYEPFSVIRVRLEDGKEREFTADLQRDHFLNQASYLPTDAQTPAELYVEHGEQIKTVLAKGLENNRHFVSVADQWFVRDLLMEIPALQLNIAEAMLDMAGGGPLPTTAFLAEMELPAEISEPLQIFSLEYALERDTRFDEVGPAGQALWYLRRMEPEAVRESPPHLRYVPIPYNRAGLGQDVLLLEKRLDDEWAESVAETPDNDQITVILNYPHWRSGTLPLTQRLQQFFPTARLTDRIRFTFIDNETGQEFPGWVVRSGHYIYGLAEWYQRAKVNVGSYIDLRRGDKVGTIVAQTRKIRSKRGEWLRTATVDNNQISFSMTRFPVVCEFDELAAFAVPDALALDALAEKIRRMPLETLLEQCFRGLAVLSLQRAVHAVTLYGALNLIRRVPPAPLLSILTTAPQYVALGDHYWAYRGED
jgi:hypothetical protein